MHAKHAFRSRTMQHAWHHHRHRQQHRQDIIYNALRWLRWLRCIALQWIAIALRCIALHCIALLALHCIMTCLESFVGVPEISQWPLDLITRFHTHVLMNAFTFAFAYDMFGIFCEICRNQSMAPRFYYSDSCTCERQEDTLTSRHKERQQERQTDKQTYWYVSHPFSLFPFHAKPGLTRPWGP